MIIRTAAEYARDGRVIPLNDSNDEGVAFAYVFISALSAVACEVAVSDLVAFEALVSSIVRAVKYGDGEPCEGSGMELIELLYVSCRSLLNMASI